MKMRQKKFRRAVSALLALVMVTAVVFIPPGVTEVWGASDAKAKSYDDQIAALNAEQKSLKNQINSLASERTETLEYKATLDKYINTTQSKIDLANSMIEELTAQIASTEEEIAGKEADVEETFNIFLERMKTSYEDSSKMSYLGLLLGADSLTEFLSRSEKISCLLDYDKKLMEQYETDKAELQDARESLAQSKALQETTLTTLESDKANYQSMVAQSEQYAKELESDQAAYEKQLAASKAKEDELNNELVAYLKQLEAQQQTAYVGGEFNWPVPVSYKTISSGYGYRTWSSGYKEFHAAIDIPAPSGTPIYASNGGTVVKSEWHYSYGNYVLINHGGGKSTLYAHMTSRAVAVGATVSQGQVIGYVGMTGNAQGNHIHFEVRINGDRVNPLSYVVAP